MKKVVSLLLALVLIFAMSSVAMAAEVEADTFAELKDALEAGKSVKLTADINAETGVITIPAGVTTAVLDLNGKTIEATDTTTSSYWVIYVSKGAELTVEDNSEAKTGGITVTAMHNNGWDRMSNVFEVRGGVLNLKGGTFEHKGGTDMSYVVDINANSYGDATLNVYNGAILDSTYIAIRLYMDSTIDNLGSGTAYLNVYGGEISGVRRAIWGQAPSGNSGQTGEVVIKDGKIDGIISMPSGAKSDTSLEISGGTVEDIVAEATEIIISGGTITGTLDLSDASGNEVTGADVITGGTFTGDQDITGFISGDVEIKTDKDGNTYIGEEAIAEMPAPPAAKRYDIKVADTKNGDVTVKGSASYDSGVIITAAPHYGYEVGKVTVTAADGKEVKVTNRADGTYSFSMPRGEVSIKVTFVPQGEAVKMVLTIGSTTAIVDGAAVQSDVAPVIKAGRTFLPIRLIAEALGAKVEWNNDAQTVTITKGETVIVLTIGSTTVTVNGQPTELEAAVFIESSRTFLPVRFIAEKLGADVEWNGATNEVTISGRK